MRWGWESQWFCAGCRWGVTSPGVLAAARGASARLVLCDTRATADSLEAAAGRLQTADRVLAEGAEFLAETMIPKLLAPAREDAAGHCAGAASG